MQTHKHSFVPLLVLRTPVSARILALVLQLYERNRPKLKLKQTRGLKKTTILYDYLTIMPTLRLTYDKRLIYKTSYKEPKAFVRYDSLAKL